MVAKHCKLIEFVFISLNLAKIHMVAKRQAKMRFCEGSLNLAKIHMVAKPCALALCLALVLI